MENSSDIPHLPACSCGLWDQELMPYHEWYVVSPEYHNCFWTYIAHNNRPHSLKEVAQLLGLSLSATTAIERKTINKFKRKLKKAGISVKSLKK